MYFELIKSFKCQSQNQRKNYKIKENFSHARISHWAVEVVYFNYFLYCFQSC